MKRTVYSMMVNDSIVTSLFGDADNAIAFTVYEYINMFLKYWDAMSENNIDKFEKDLRTKGVAEFQTTNGKEIFKVVELEIEYRCETTVFKGKTLSDDFLEWMDKHNDGDKLGDEPTFNKSQEVDDVYLLIESNYDGAEIVEETFSSIFEAIIGCKECIKEKEEWHDTVTMPNSPKWSQMERHLTDYWSCEDEETEYWWNIVKVTKITEHE